MSRMRRKALVGSDRKEGFRIRYSDGLKCHCFRRSVYALRSSRPPSLAERLFPQSARCGKPGPRERCASTC